MLNCKPACSLTCSPAASLRLSSIPIQPILSHHVIRRVAQKRHRRSNVVTASILPDSVDHVLTTATVVGSGLVILGTAALALRAEPLTEPEERKKQDEEGFDYGLMGIVSFLPMFNWTAWILPALTRPERAPLYYSLAALYAMPLLRNGFDFDAYVWTMYALMIMHVQVERVAQTEPSTLRDLGPVADMLKGLAVAAGAAGSFASSLVGIVAADSRHIITGSPHPPPDSRNTRSGQQQGQQGGNQQQQGQQQGQRSIEGPTRVPVDELELKQFDRQLMERDGKRGEK